MTAAQVAAGLHEIGLRACCGRRSRLPRVPRRRRPSTARSPRRMPVRRRRCLGEAYSRRDGRRRRAAVWRAEEARAAGHLQVRPQHPELRARARVPAVVLLHGRRTERRSERQDRAGRAASSARSSARTSRHFRAARSQAVKRPCSTSRDDRGAAGVPEDRGRVRRSGRCRLQGPGAEAAVERRSGRRTRDPLGRGPPRSLDARAVRNHTGGQAFDEPATRAEHRPHRRLHPLHRRPRRR